MPFWSFNKIAPPAPDDPQVDVDTQLNDNWDLADEKLSLISQEPVLNVLLDAEVGQEWIYNGRLGVWDGAALVFPEDIEAAWTPWEILVLTAPTGPRTSFTPKWRRNTLVKQVELSGGVIYNSAAAWPTSFTVFSADTEVAGIPIAYQPNGGITYVAAATSIPSGVNRGAGANIAIDVPGVNPSCRLRARFMGGSGGGNFIALDGVRWYY